jgi:hypothetical protein
MSAVTPIQVRLPDQERDELDNYRREQPNPPSRARAARELIRLALDRRHLTSEWSATETDARGAA